MATTGLLGLLFYLITIYWSKPDQDREDQLIHIRNIYHMECGSDGILIKNNSAIMDMISPLTEWDGEASEAKETKNAD